MKNANEGIKMIKASNFVWSYAMFYIICCIDFPLSLFSLLFSPSLFFFISHQLLHFFFYFFKPSPQNSNIILIFVFLSHMPYPFIFFLIFYNWMILIFFLAIYLLLLFFCSFLCSHLLQTPSFYTCLSYLIPLMSIFSALIPW